MATEHTPLPIHEVAPATPGYHAVRLTRIWNWLGDCGVFFDHPDCHNSTRTGCFGGNQYDAFLRAFDIIYVCQNELWLHVAPKSGVRVHDAMECLAGLCITTFEEDIKRQRTHVYSFGIPPPLAVDSSEAEEDDESLGYCECNRAVPLEEFFASVFRRP